MNTENKEVLMMKFAEPFAMCVPLGQAADVVFVYEDGSVETDFYNIFKDKESYNHLKERHPILNGCYWNGPSDDADYNEVVIRTEPGEGLTRIPKGYKHFCLGGGSHLVIRSDKFDAYIAACGELVDEDKRYKLDVGAWMDFTYVLFS